MRQVFGIVRYNFFGFLRNPKVIFIFLLEFVLSFLLTGRIMVVMETYDTPVQAIEPFIWTFGDGIADGLGIGKADLRLQHKVDIHFRQLPRSEERRVGKECRSRWSPYH